MWIECQRDKARGQASRQQACGELERQSLSVKAQKRCDNTQRNSRQISRLVKKAGGHKNPMEHKTFNLHFLSGCTDRPRPSSYSEAPLTARPERREGRPDTAVRPTTKI